MDRRINKSILDEWMGNQMNRWMDIKLDGLIDRQTGDEQTAKKMDRQIDGYIGGYTYIQRNKYIKQMNV